MSQVISGDLMGDGLQFVIVASRFNELITNKLVGGATDALVRHGVADEGITTAWVPGALEIPLVAKKALESGKYDAAICLGAVIRGATGHYDAVVQGVSRGVADVALSTGIPAIFGVLTCDTIEQALERAGTKAGNKGFEAATAAIEMANLMRLLR